MRPVLKDRAINPLLTHGPLFCPASSVTSTYISYPISTSHWEAYDFSVQNTEIFADSSAYIAVTYIAVQRITLSLRIRESPGTNFGAEAVFLGWFFVVFPQSSLRQNITHSLRSSSFEITEILVLSFKANHNYGQRHQMSNKWWILQTNLTWRNVQYFFSVFVRTKFWRHAVG
jgi:hypothetical protein